MERSRTFKGMLSRKRSKVKRPIISAPILQDRSPSPLPPGASSSVTCRSSSDTSLPTLTPAPSSLLDQSASPRSHWGASNAVPPLEVSDNKRDLAPADTFIPGDSTLPVESRPLSAPIMTAGSSPTARLTEAPLINPPRRTRPRSPPPRKSSISIPAIPELSSVPPVAPPPPPRPRISSRRNRATHNRTPSNSSSSEPDEPKTPALAATVLSDEPRIHSESEIAISLPLPALLDTGSFGGAEEKKTQHTVVQRVIITPTADSPLALLAGCYFPHTEAKRENAGYKKRAHSPAEELKLLKSAREEADRVYREAKRGRQVVRVAD